MHALDSASIRDLDRSPTSPPLPPPPQHPHFTRLAHSHGTMNPNSKLILDEMSHLFKEQSTKFDLCFSEMDHKLGSLKQCFVASDRALETRLTEIDASVTK
jgi:hypothetical protein